jgi:AcrR family transcriptional regulator
VERDLHVLAVAERLFLEKGYHQVSLALVASSAGVATRTIYARFGDKRAILEEILECRREASGIALAALSTAHLASGQALYRMAVHAIEHELSPSLELLHADLLADRETCRKPGRRWAEEGEWRALLEQILAPAPACVADVFVACLMKEQRPEWRAGEHRPHDIIDGVACRVVARFAEQIGALNMHAAAMHAE